MFRSGEMAAGLVVKVADFSGLDTVWCDQLKPVSYLGDVGSNPTRDMSGLLIYL